MPNGSLLRFPGGRQAFQRYVREMSAIYQRQLWIDDPDFALANDDDIYSKLERDPIIFHSLQIRTLSVTGQTWHLEPASEEDLDKDAAAVVEDLLGQIREFNQARAQIFRGALLSGRGYGWIRGSRRKMSIADRPVQNWWVPQRIEHQDKRSFHFEPTHMEVDSGTRRVGQKLQFWNIARSEWVDLLPNHLRALIRLTYENRADRLGYGQGIAVPLYLYFRAKGLAFMYLQAANEMWGQGGIVAAKIDPDREGDTSKTSEQIRDDMLDTIEDMRSRHAIVFDKNDEIEIISPASAGTDLPLRTIEYADKCMTRVILGSVRPTGGATGDGGARAQAEVEQEVTDIITQSDRSMCDEAMTEHLIRCVWDLNRANIVSIGLGKAKMPRFVTSVERKADPVSAIAIITQALQAEIPLKKDEVYTALDFTPPAEGDAVFKGAPKPEPANGGGLPFDLGPVSTFSEWDETKHERSESGKFGPKSGDGAKEKPVEITDAATGRDAIKALGVEMVSVEKGSDPQPLRVAYDALSLMKESGAFMPEHIKFTTKGLEGQANGLYYPDSGNIAFDSNILSASHQAKRTEDATKREGEPSGYLSHGDIRSTVFHEVGHLNHHMNVMRTGGDWNKFARRALSPEQTQTALNEVSVYSASQPIEFVAEVYAATFAGKKFSKEVEDIYREFLGPPINGFGA